MTAPAGKRLLMIEQGGRGGVADYTAELVRALGERGWAVTLATAADHRYRSTPGVTVVPAFHYLRDDTRFGRAVRSRGLGKAFNGLRFLLSLPRLAWLARRADVVHSQGWEIPQLGLLAVAWLRLSGRPVIQTSHGTFERASSFLRTRLVVRRITGRLLTCTVVHTQADLDRVRAWVGDRAVAIPHGEYGGLAGKGGAVERDPARAALGIPAEAPVTLMFGQMRPDKGLDELAEAVRQVPELHLLIGGQEAGGLAAAQTQLSSPELNGRVTLREGFLDMEQAAELFAAADTVALPYRQASQSGVLLLAYGFARPVVVYPAGGMVESVLDGQTGWVCAQSSVPALAEALADSVRAGREECERRGREGRSFSEERFSWSAIARRTGELYEQVLAGVSRDQPAQAPDDRQPSQPLRRD